MQDCPIMQQEMPKTSLAWPPPLPMYTRWHQSRRRYNSHNKQEHQPLPPRMLPWLLPHQRQRCVSTNWQLLRYLQYANHLPPLRSRSCTFFSMQKPSWLILLLIFKNLSKYIYYLIEIPDSISFNIFFDTSSFFKCYGVAYYHFQLIWCYVCCCIFLILNLDQRASSYHIYQNYHLLHMPFSTVFSRQLHINCPNWHFDFLVL